MNNSQNLISELELEEEDMLLQFMLSDKPFVEHLLLIIKNLSMKNQKDNLKNYYLNMIDLFL